MQLHLSLIHIFREILRVGGHETDAFQPFDFINLAQKLGKRHRLLEILSVRVDVLTEQHDLHNAVCNEAFDPVSYTHLDVYKRQRQSSAEETSAFRKVTSPSFSFLMLFFRFFLAF